jgi:hypothetical protein
MKLSNLNEGSNLQKIGGSCVATIEPEIREGRKTRALLSNPTY